MPRLQSYRQQTERRDDGKIDIVLHRHEPRFRASIQFRNRVGIAGIDLLDLRILVHDLRLVIAHLVDLVRDLVEIFLPNNDANQFFATESHPVTLNRFAGPSPIRKWIERELSVESWSEPDWRLLRVECFLFNHCD